MILISPLLTCCVKNLRHFIFALFTLLAVLPGRLHASQSVELTWNASPSYDVVGYHVYYGTRSGVYPDAVRVADIADVVIPGLQDGQTYYFAVAAVDGQGHESGLSPEAVYQVPWPSSVRLQVVTSTAAINAVDAFWTPSGDNDAFTYTISYGTQSGVYTNFATFDFVTEGVVSGLVPGATYYFQVTPMDTLGVALGASPEVAYLVPMPAPIALHATPAATGGVQLSWTDLTAQAAAGYKIYYGTGSAFYTARTTCGPMNNLVIPDLTPGQAYYFVVAAVDSYGNQGFFSNEAEAAASAPPPGILLQMQVYKDTNGHPNYLQIFSPSRVSGAWEMDYSPDLHNWTPYAHGVGNGSGNGADVNVGVWIDSASRRMFFRVQQ